jgi:hypothetical protein
MMGIQKLQQGSYMPEQSPKEESVSLEQLVVSHSYEMLALITVLEKKGILARQEIIEVIKELQNGGVKS